jgi:nitrite reductase (cytochrome c-552)
MPEDEIRVRVETIQDRTRGLLTRAEAAVIDLMTALADAKASGASDAELAEVRKLHRRAQWRLDFVAAENSMGFHAPQEAARILAEAIDDARLGQARAVALRSTRGRP